MTAHSVSVVDKVRVTRQKTDEGFIRARAGLTRTGIFLYTDRELGVGDEGEVVRVMRTPETVFHPDTIASLTGAPITLGHPEDLKPANWRDHVVGNISGVPQRVGDNLEADVLIGDQRGIDALDEGIDEVSVGYTFGLLRADGDVGYQYKTDGAMTVQHSAIVPAGRAGPNIRIYDRRGDAMTPEDRKQIVDELKDSLVKELKGGDASPDAVAAAVERGMKPLTDRMDKFEKDAADAATAKAEDERKQADEARANQLIADTVAIERKRAAVFDAALPLIDESKRAGLRDASTRDILEAAVGDSIENVKDASDDYLRGIVDMMTKDRARVNLPAGATGVRASDFDDARAKFVQGYKDYLPPELRDK